MGNEVSSSADSTVYQASRSGDSARIQRLLAGEEDDQRRQRLLEWKDQQGRTPLIIAAQKGCLECLLELLRLGADVHQISDRDFGGSALHEAVYYKWRSNGIVEALLRHGANPFVKNSHDRTALQLALIGNASKEIYTPWLISFDRYGYFAEELMVRTKFLGEDPAWISRWVTIVPVYSTSDPQNRRCLKRTMIVYDGYYSRMPVSFIDLDGAHAEVSSDHLVHLVLSPELPQPGGVSSTKTEDSGWCISLNATFHNGLESLYRLVSAVNGDAQTIIERQLHHNHREAGSEDASVTAIQRAGTAQPRAATQEPGTTQPNLPVSGASDAVHAVNQRKDFSMHDSSAGMAAQQGHGDGADINDGVCVVCLDKPQNAGFRHGDSVHHCVCLSCAFLVYLSDRNRCPMCRRTIDCIVSDDH